MATRALVLGGGGVIGVAWESGLLARLHAQGVNLTGLGGLGGLALRGEARRLRAKGSRVEQLLPDTAALLTFGPNLMNAARRAAAAEAGYRQGTALAARLRGVWTT